MFNIPFSIHSLPVRFNFLFSPAEPPKRVSVFLFCCLVMLTITSAISKYILHIYLSKHIIHITITIFNIHKYKRCRISVFYLTLLFVLLPQAKVRNNFKVNDKGTITTSMILFWCHSVNFENIS